MYFRRMFCFGLVVMASTLDAPYASADNAASNKDEQAIRAAAKAYQAALAKGDAKAIAEFWTPDGYYIDDQGESHPASELAADMAQAATPDPQPQVKVTTSKIHLFGPNVAIEDGTSELASSDADGTPPTRGHFHAVWIKQADRWRLASLCEISSAAPADSALADLDWMVGTWTAKSNGAKLEMTARWNVTSTYLLRETKAIQDGKVLLQSSQRIGWDPLTKKLKSWAFDSDGGHSEATWIKDGDSWLAQSTGVLADGRQISGTTLITFDGKSSFTRKDLAGRLEGKSMPDQELRFTRQAEPQH